MVRVWGQLIARRLGTLALGIILPLPILSGCAVDQTGTVLSPAAIKVPTEAPRTTGPKFGDDGDHAALVASFGGEYRSMAALSLLTDVTNRLVQASDKPDESYAVTLLNSSVPNAFALPSGRLYVTRGLLALANDSSEVAAVLAHEIAHVALRHASARSEVAMRSKLVSRVVADVLNDPATGAEMESEARFSLARFSRNQEHEADAAGVRMLAKAGFDPFGAARFLTALNGFGTFKGRRAPTKEADILNSHPGTADRIAMVTNAAKLVALRGPGVDDRARYLAAIDGLAYGDDPTEGVVRGGRFVHPTLGIAFEVPSGFTIENTRSALLGTSRDGKRRMLFDQVESRTGQSLEDALKATWNDAIDAGSIETRMVSGRPAAFAVSRGKDWTFRLATVRAGERTFRMIMAARGTNDPDSQFRHWVESLVPLDPEQASALRSSRIRIVVATAADSVESLAGRMSAADHPLERFLVLNGIQSGGVLRPGQSYKIIVN